VVRSYIHHRRVDKDEPYEALRKTAVGDRPVSEEEKTLFRILMAQPSANK
jgi:hypothetical protein